MGEMRIEYSILVGKLEGKRLLRKHKHRLENNIRRDPTEIWREIVDWIHLAQDRD
jgi:hypothetical protein